jgi:hypothetical protein
MGLCGRICAVVAAICLAIGCGSTTVENPAAPSLQYPSLLGQWRGTGALELTAADGSSFGSVGCPGFWTVKFQDGGNFSGQVAFGGNSWLADRFCPYDGSFSGTIAVTGAMTLRITPPLTQGCSRVTGDGTFTGMRRTDGTIFIETSEAVTCLDVVNLSSRPTQQSGTRTIRFPWRRPTDWIESRNNLEQNPPKMR